MSYLESCANLFEVGFGQYKPICPVCKNQMPEDTDEWIEADRLTDSNLGERILRHPFNKIHVCTKVCSIRVSNAWKMNATKDKQDKLISEINEDNRRFEDACIKAQKALYLPKPKRKR